MDKIEKTLDYRSETLYYFPYHFIREIGPKMLYDKVIRKYIFDFSLDPHHQIIEFSVENHVHYFYLAYLAWDSEHFHIPVYKVFTVLYHHSDFAVLCQAVRLFRNSFIADGRKYCFIELPVEDTLLLRAFTAAGFRLIETRLTYYKDNVQLYENARFPVRTATADDIPNLKTVASQTRNPYDRVHADTFFTPETADHYLATYAEQAVKGFADIVLVPDEKNIPPDAFVAVSYLNKDSKALHCQLSRIMLMAVAPVCRGWHYKLVSEAIYQAKSIGASYLLMTTQATNRAVIRNCEKLGFSFGACSHILSYNIE